MKKYIRSNTNARPDYSKFSAWRASDTCVEIDGEKCWYSKYKAYVDDDNTLMILPKYDVQTDTLYYELLIFHGYNDMDIIEDQFINPKAAMEYTETTLIPDLLDNLVKASTSIMSAAWSAPNGRKYGKQTKRFPGKYLFTRKELKSMVDSGIAQDLGGTFDPMQMDYDIIGISWNETNGYRSGILIVDNDTGELYVGNSADANKARL